MRSFICTRCGKVWYCSAPIKYMTSPLCDGENCGGWLEECEDEKKQEGDKLK